MGGGQPSTFPVGARYCGAVNAPPHAPGWHTLTCAEALARLDTGGEGLSTREAAARLHRYGPNVVEPAPPPGVLAIALRQLRDPLISILTFALVVTLALQEFIDAGVIATALVLDLGLGLSQELRAERSVRALMNIISLQARAVRDGHEQVIDASQLVPGDLVVLESGIRAPADLRLLAVTSLTVDESLLTGESVPVSKQTAPVERDLVVADRTNMVFAGTVVAAGRGRGVVVATGESTQIGAIAESIQQREPPKTPLQQQLVALSRVITVAVIASGILSFGLGIALGNSASEMFAVAVALGVAAVPEGLPVAFTVALALGVRRMAARNAIVRSLPAVETLGSTSVIGSDKTGTLTENRMTVQVVSAGSQLVRIDNGQLDREPSRSLLAVLEAGVLANEAEAWDGESGLETRGDPTETALLRSAQAFGVDVPLLRQERPVLREIPFESERQYSASLRDVDGAPCWFVKGAPERVAQLCTTMISEGQVTPIDEDAVRERAHELASQGLRLLAMAHGPGSHDGPRELTFLGIQGMMDPPREGVKEAIAASRRAGVRVIMITGDHAVTATAIAGELGIARDGDGAVTGVELERMDDADLREAVRTVNVFARVSPEHKLRIVEALQAHGHVVAVTGDGVNDAPALRAADIGIAMGRSGTDVAREAAAMVLADDNFVSISAAVEEGRGTFDNIRKVTYFLVSTGVASILTILGALMFGWEVPFVAAQLLWLNLVTCGLQDLALAFEPREPGILDRPPRPRREGIISRVLWERTAILGLVMAAGTLALFYWVREVDRVSIEEARTTALTTMVLFQVFQTGNSRSEYLSIFRITPFSNRFLFLSTVLAVGVHVLALHTPPTQYVLRLEPLPGETWLRMVAVASTVLLASELHKAVRRPPWKASPPALAAKAEVQ